MGVLSNPGMNREWDAPTRAAREHLLRRDNLIELCKQTNFVEKYLAARAPAVRLRDWTGERLGREAARVAMDIRTESAADASLDYTEDTLDLDWRWKTQGPEAATALGRRRAEALHAPVATVGRNRVAPPM